MSTNFRPPKQWVLSESETITSYANWQSNMLYHLSLCNDFSPFLETEWGKQPTANRGLTNDGDEVPLANRKTAVQKKIVLERMLGLIAQFAPSLLRNEIIKRSTSLSWIWQRIRRHYSFSQSEVNFLALHTIKRKDDERYETFYQRIIAHLEDNLLTVTSRLQHDGEVPTVDEVMSPTTERLAVYMWLSLIDQRLPAYIARVFAHDLQTKTLKDIQPLLSQSMDSLLAEITAQEDIQIHYARSSFKTRNNSKPFLRDTSSPSQNRPSNSAKNCTICKAAGRKFQGHNVASCWFLSKFEKLEIAKALQVTVDDFDDDLDTTDESHVNQVTNVNEGVPAATIQKVECDSSPFFYAFYHHHPCHVVVDTGATSSIVSRSFLQSVGITPRSTLHSARSADKSRLEVQGEVHITLQFAGMNLPITALVLDKLDCDILAGIPFCKTNDVQIHLKSECISIKDIKVPYGSKDIGKTYDVNYAESFILRNGSPKVVMPGEFVEVYADELKPFNGEVSIEPRNESPLCGTWPEPSISRVIQGSVRIPNLSDEAIPLSKSQHIAQIRRIIVPPDSPAATSIPISPKTRPLREPKFSNFSDTVMVDPDGQLSFKERQCFIETNERFDNVFSPHIGCYNDQSGHIRASINIGPVEPPPRKGKLPLYNHVNLQQLQIEADKLEQLGVLAKPEDVGVQVKFVSPSFLVKKPNGGFRFVTAFNNLGQYARILPTANMSCDEVLRKISSFKYLIKTDFTKSFYQIRLAKSSMPYLATVTPFKGLRVYLRSAMGMPGSSEYLQELTARVFGDFMQEGFVTMIADDLFVGANTIDKLSDNWNKVLDRMQKNNLTLAASKTVICPKQTIILGWNWNSGTLSPCSHKTAALASVAPPKTCTAMRSFIGAFKAVSRCIKGYSSLLSPLEDATKGLEGANAINWSPALTASFNKAQSALRSPSILTIPKPSDHLILTVDASPVNKGLGATLFVQRDRKRYLAEFYSFKLKNHQMTWYPCELEALAISAGVNHFAPFARESQHPLQVLTDSKPCVQAYHRLCEGQFSASARVSTFLSTLSSHRVSVNHLPGSANSSSDYSSRHPVQCDSINCQICKFVESTATSVVNAISVNDVLSGSVTLPFLNKAAWRSAQHDCADLRRTYAHLTQGTRPSRKARNLKNLRRYLNVASVDDQGLIIVYKQDPGFPRRSLIVVPVDLLPGIITALHLHFQHASKHQLKLLFNRYFFAIKSEDVIHRIVDQCVLCNSVKAVPSEIFKQSLTISKPRPGQVFFADILRRSRQKICVLRDVFSSFTAASIIEDETSCSLRKAIILNTSIIRAPKSTIRIDSASGFQSLRNDTILSDHGITLDFGYVKNKNSNCVVDKGIQELELELLKAGHSNVPITSLQLQSAVDILNMRIRNRGLSAKEIILQRDQHSYEKLDIDDSVLALQQQAIRQRNHEATAPKHRPIMVLTYTDQ